MLCVCLCLVYVRLCVFGVCACTGFPVDVFDGVRRNINDSMFGSLQERCGNSDDLKIYKTSGTLLGQPTEAHMFV